jgi:hypothetical protein
MSGVLEAISNWQLLLKLTIAHLGALRRPPNTSLLRVSRVYVYKEGCSVLHSNSKSPLQVYLSWAVKHRVLTHVPLYSGPTNSLMRACHTLNNFSTAKTALNPESSPDV